MHPDPLTGFIWFDKRRPALCNLAKNLCKIMRQYNKLTRCLQPWHSPLGRIFVGMIAGSVLAAPFLTMGALIIATCLMLLMVVYFSVVCILLGFNRRRLRMLLKALVLGDYGPAMGKKTPPWENLEAALALEGYRFQELHQQHNVLITPFVATYLTAIHEHRNTYGVSLEAHKIFMAERAAQAARAIAAKMQEPSPQ